MKKRRRRRRAEKDANSCNCAVTADTVEFVIVVYITVKCLYRNYYMVNSVCIQVRDIVKCKYKVRTTFAYI